jgi:hypothetical protein
MNLKKERKLLIGVCILWALLVAGGAAAVLNYQSTPGMAAPMADWPGESVFRAEQTGDTLVMIAHPRCPCTKASLAELGRLMDQAQGRLIAYVIFIKPKNFPVEWEKSELWATAEAIPGVRVMVDNEGVEAEKFQAATSGQSMLYDNNGRLLFSGGITNSRGHEGDNDGRDAIMSFLNKGESEEGQTPVYGCPLFAPENEKSVKDTAQ